MSVGLGRKEHEIMDFLVNAFSVLSLGRRSHRKN